MKKRSAMPDVMIQDQHDADLPEGWVMACVKDIADINPRHPKGLVDSMPVSFVPMAALNEDSPTFACSEERPYGEVRKGFTHFREGDVLFAKITPCMENGKGAVATGLRNGIGCGTTELHVLRPLGGIDPMYLYRFLSQRSVRREAAETFTSSAGQARVPTRFIEELDIPLPPLAEQKCIVAKVEELLARVNAAREHLAKVPAILKRFRQSVLAAACSGRLTEEWRAVNLRKGESRSQKDELPTSWERQRLGDLTSLITKGASPKWQGVNYSTKGVLFITSENVGVGRLLIDAKKYVEPRINDIQPRSILKRGDILTNIVGASIGRSAIFGIDEVANINQAVALIRLKAGIDSMYVLLVMNSPMLVEHMNGEKVDVARANISLKDVANYPIPVPPLHEQHEIVRRVDGLFALAGSIEKQAAAGAARVEKLAQTILAKAFRGELVPPVCGKVALRMVRNC